MPPGVNDEPAWDSLARETARAFEGLGETCSAAVPLLDTYAACRLVAALQDRGVFTTQGERRATDDAIARPVPAMTRLLSACLDVLARQGWIEPVADGFRAADRIAAAPTERANAAARLAREHPDKTGIVTVIDATVPRLPEVIAGAVEPTQVIFPEGSMDLVLSYYKGHPLADSVNRQCASVIGRLALWLAGRTPQRPVRLLEVGAGTGTTTLPILAELKSAGVAIEYVFTDLSGVFVGRAQRALGAAHPELRFARYDIEAPAEQSTSLGAFDIVLAANAVHATADIAGSLQHLATRIAPGGVLVLNEITSAQDHLTLCFGMLPGWWRATDRRSFNGPLLSVADWRDRLGPLFQTRIIAGPGNDPANPLQSLIVATLRDF